MTLSSALSVFINLTIIFIPHQKLHFVFMVFTLRIQMLHNSKFFPPPNLTCMHTMHCIYYTKPVSPSAWTHGKHIAIISAS